MKLQIDMESGRLLGPLPPAIEPPRVQRSDQIFIVVTDGHRPPLQSDGDDVLVLHDRRGGPLDVKELERDMAEPTLQASLSDQFEQAELFRFLQYDDELPGDAGLRTYAEASRRWVEMKWSVI
jgi:hypothetical protein